ncbi:hypothetical protein ACEZDB_06750 [Streptacidiphilus sp. N1-3]|uniref:DUF6891 domain-containing protein n=1 Tax=Streptacidiphilus alkalitolerans TaxID=3342712 RepID=A0ABV6WWF6_9ACTN
MDTAPDVSTPLPILLTTEDGDVRSGPTEAVLAAVLAGLGTDGNRYAVVERDADPRQNQVFVQAWRRDDGVYEVEHRDGAPERHFGAELSSPERVAELFLDWVGDGDGWVAAVDWTPLDLTSTPALEKSARAEAEEFARSLIRCGFDGYWDVVRAVQEHFVPEELQLSTDQASRIVAGPWQERAQQQESWPVVTDPDRLATAFAALEARGVTARMNFACCGSCGRGEIGAEAPEGARGYVFFHRQATAGAANGGPLWLSYGHFANPGAADPTTANPGTVGPTPAEIGAEVVAELTAAGLRAEWDGSPDSAVKLTSLEWLKRLPV